MTKINPNRPSRPPVTGHAESVCPQSAVSPPVHPDGRVIFHLERRGAREVLLRLDGLSAPLPMQERDGIWSITSDPLQSGSYSYCFLVDGRAELDPLNPQSVPNYAYLCSTLRITDGVGSPWDRADVPHGTLRRHFYTSNLILGLPAGHSEYLVYTPPGYETNGAIRYPTIYLLHGLSQGPADWTSMGQAHFLLDNLIAQGTVKPMIVVMPLGYGDLAVAARQPSDRDFAPLLFQSNHLFARILLEEIMPQIESGYSVIQSREGRAVAGLSMGGAQSLNFGLHHGDVFAWSAAFSAAVPFVQRPPANSPDRKPVRLWISCGTADWLIDLNRSLVTDLKQQGYPMEWIETHGGHIWPVWQRNLVDYAQLLF